MNTKSYIKVVWIFTLIIILGSEFVYRALKAGVNEIYDSPITLLRPLEAIPYAINGWTGESQLIPTTTEEYMKKNYADEYINRLYVKGNEAANLYVVYCSTNIAGILGHRPGVCYPAYGWQQDGTELKHFITSSGRNIPCLFHQFSKQYPNYQNIYVLSFYIVNGRLTSEESEFSGFWNRRLNWGKDASRYVAQVQISSTSQHVVLKAASEFVDDILICLPESQTYNTD